MKRSTIIFFILMSSAFFYGYGILTIQYRVFPYDAIKAVENTLRGKPSDQTRSFYHLNKKSFFEQLGHSDYDVVFVGASIVDGAEWQEMFPNLKVANRGIGGDTTDGLLERIDTIISTNAKRAFVMIGINDFIKGTSVDTAFNNYQKIITELQNNNIEVYVQSTIFCGKRRAAINKSIMQLNQKLENLANTTGNFTFIDINKNLAENDALNPKFTFDDEHLNGAGYKAWQQVLTTYLKG